MKKTIWLIILLGACEAVFAQPPDTLWTHHYGAQGQENGYSVWQTTDGGYVMGGVGYGGAANMWLVRANANGDSLWSRTFHTGTGDSRCYSLQQTTDGGYILAGIAYVGSQSYTD